MIKGWISLIFAVCFVALVSCGEGSETPHRLFASFAVGIFDSERKLNSYIPDVQIWSNGRVVYTSYSCYSRQVIEGQIDLADQMNLINMAESDQFQQLHSRYTDPYGRTGVPAACISYTPVKNESKNICVFGDAFVPAFHAMRINLRVAALSSMLQHHFIPTKAYVRAYSSQNEATHRWAGTTLNIDSDNGVWKDGSELRDLWFAANHRLVLSESGKQFTVTVQIPNISMLCPTLNHEDTGHSNTSVLPINSELLRSKSLYHWLAALLTALFICVVFLCCCCYYYRNSRHDELEPESEPATEPLIQAPVPALNYYYYPQLGYDGFTPQFIVHNEKQ